MTLFGNYANYYDLLYRDKDYAGEAEYIDGLIKTYAPDAKTILNLGCGTGRHDFLLAQKGYSVTGVDMSDEMIAVANSQLSTFNAHLSSLSFLQGDIRSILLNRTFDVIISLFHVISYQTTNEDLKAAFATVKAHLKPGGIFIFDCWYGPAVLTDRPEVRVKRMEDEDIKVTRIAEPVMHPNENVVDVNYNVFIKDKASGRVEELRESHKMRYLFAPEIDFLLIDNGMSALANAQWLSAKRPGCDTWSVYWVAMLK